MHPRFCYDVAASPLHDAHALAPILGRLAAELGSLGGERVPTEDAPAETPLFQLVLTGGSERVVLDRYARRRERAGKEPLIVLAHPSHNSLAASLELLARVRTDGGSGQLLLLGDEGFAERLHQTARLATVERMLRTARIGALGPPSDWLVASAHPPSIVKESWGPEVVPLPLDDLFSRLASAPGDELARDLRAGATRCVEPDEKAMNAAAGVFRSLESLIADLNLRAITVRCFDLLMRHGTTSCLALSLLADQGIPAGCEGDVPSVLALLWLQALTGEAAWMANPSRIHLERAELVLAHCTVPLSLTRAYTLRSHFESGQGVALGGELPPGPVTLVRIGGPRLEKRFLCEGELSPGGGDESLCRTQAVVRVPRESLEELLERPLGNHLVLVPGLHARSIRGSRRFVLGIED